MVLNALFPLSISQGIDALTQLFILTFQISLIQCNLPKLMMMMRISLVAALLLDERVNGRPKSK